MLADSISPAPGWEVREVKNMPLGERCGPARWRRAARAAHPARAPRWQLFCVPIPCESEWSEQEVTREADEAPRASPSPARRSRKRVYNCLCKLP